MDKYILCEVLGTGTFAEVYAAEHRETHEKVAIKRIKECWTEHGLLQCVLREISILRELDHPHIVKLQDVILTRVHTALVFEHLSADLATYLRRTQMKEGQIKIFFHQISLAVSFVHRHGIIHRDLKPANILVLHDNFVKVADFGSAKEVDVPVRPDHPVVVTLFYRPPELLLASEVHGMAVDVWSIGCIVAEMCLKTRFFSWDVNNMKFLEPEKNQLFEIYKILGKPTSQTWPGITNLPKFEEMRDVYENQFHFSFHEAMRGTMSMQGQDLLKRMFAFSPDRRITCAEIVSDGYFVSSPK
uniref:Protein kinase domain-containing protein n=1 Tax=Steinernema glaseri TaxID=37863 RepID=A0A1I7YDW7_9BILA